MWSKIYLTAIDKFVLCQLVKALTIVLEWFPCLFYSMDVRQLSQTKFCFLVMRLKIIIRSPKFSHWKDVWNSQRSFLHICRYQLKTKETFDTKKVGYKEVSNFMVDRLVGSKMQRQIPEMRCNKAKWVCLCKIRSVSQGVLSSWLKKWTMSILSTNTYTYNSLRGFVENL